VYFRFTASSILIRTVIEYCRGTSSPKQAPPLLFPQSQPWIKWATGSHPRSRVRFLSWMNWMRPVEAGLRARTSLHMVNSGLAQRTHEFQLQARSPFLIFNRRVPWLKGRRTQLNDLNPTILPRPACTR
jgi:hypothetical protein